MPEVWRFWQLLYCGGLFESFSAAAMVQWTTSASRLKRKDGQAGSISDLDGAVLDELR
jgi:hypothetical protein